MIFRILSVTYFLSMIATGALVCTHSVEPGHLRDNTKAYIVSKTVTSAFLLVMAAASFFISYDSMLKLLVPALPLCFLGDLFLALADEIDDKSENPQFATGVAAFALAQVCFMISMMKILNWHVAWIIIIPFAVVIMNVMKWKKNTFDYGSNKIPICIYACLVAMSAGLGLQLILTEMDNPAYLMLGIGMVLFLLSDAVLEIKLFQIRKVKLAGLGVVVLYFTAMWCVCCSIYLTVN